MKTRPSDVNCGNINAIAITHEWSVKRYHHREFMILFIFSSDTKYFRFGTTLLLKALKKTAWNKKWSWGRGHRSNNVYTCVYKHWWGSNPLVYTDGHSFESHWLSSGVTFWRWKSYLFLHIWDFSYFLTEIHWIHLIRWHKYF